jgi:hypothetical protein
MNSSTGTSTMNTAAPAKTAAKRVAKKTEETAAPVAATPAPVAAAAPAAVEKKVTKKAAAKTEAAAPAPAAPAVVAPVATEAAAEAPQQTVGDEIRGMITQLNSLREVISTLHSQLKKLDKRVHREIKDARKRKRRARTEGADGEQKPARLSIFEIPTRLSDDLCAFLGKPKGSEMSRSNVTKAVTTYIKEKGLKNKHDIQPDAALRKLLAVPTGESLTYFNLQKYLNKHYVKVEKPVAH